MALWQRQELSKGARCSKVDYAPSSRQAMTKPLSPAAQAVLDATGVQGTALELPARGIAAAALRAVADQLREAYANEEYVDSADDWLDDIAAELEAQ